MDVIFLKECMFYVKDDEVALEVYEDFRANKIVYDGKNTLVLTDNKNGRFIVQNIVFDVRRLLKKDKTLMIIHSKDDEIEDVYELKIHVNENSIFKDDLREKAKEFFEKVYEEAKAAAE